MILSQKVLFLIDKLDVLLYNSPTTVHSGVKIEKTTKMMSFTWLIHIAGKTHFLYIFLPVRSNTSYNASVEKFSIVEKFSYPCAFQRGGRYAHRLLDNESGTRHL
jgi:hypothetical protein